MIYNVRYVTYFLVVTSVVAVWHCATPTQPDGGPADRTPPQLVDTEPVTGTTMFEGDRIRFQFSKYVDRSSFRRAFRMEPEIDLDYEIRWSRRTATVRFNDPLPDTTTIIFTLGTDLADTRNNRIPTPYQLALSTGPDIDEGRINATVKDAGTGEGMAGERVMLYRYPVNLNVGADYVGEANADGIVRFNNLREGSYMAFWLDDRNRNRKWDRELESAQPFMTDSLFLEHGGEADLGTVFLVRNDTVAPVLQAVGMLSEVRLRLRFTEMVTFEEDAMIEIYHSDGLYVTEALPLYIDPDNNNVLYAQTLNPLPGSGSYQLDISGITDASGNYVSIGIENFPGSDEPDTTYARYIGHDTRHGVSPHEPLAIRYAKILDESPEVLDSLIIIERQATHHSWPHAEISGNLLLIYPDVEWQPGENYELRVWDENRMERRTIQPRIYFEDDLGGIDIVVEEPRTDTTRHRLELVNEQGYTLRSESFLYETALTEIPPGSYVLRVYELRDETARRWDPGAVEPYRPPDRYFIQQEIPVERGLTGQVYVQW
ncbi:MAG: Ig-like domain-containing protein [Balneolales bacterium]